MTEVVNPPKEQAIEVGSRRNLALMGLAAGTEFGVQAMLIYMAIYITMNVGTFAFILSMERDGVPVTDIAALNRFFWVEPVKGLAMLVLIVCAALFWELVATPSELFSLSNLLAAP